MCNKGSQLSLDGYLKPNEMCCACGGGVTPDDEDITPDDEDKNWFESGSICRNSDYRTVASDPNFDVTSMQADVYERGYYMLMSVTARPKDNSFEETTVIYVFGGW